MADLLLTFTGDNHPFLNPVIITVNGFFALKRRFLVSKGGNHPNIPMPNARKKGLKLVGAFVPTDVDEALTLMASMGGYRNKASFLRHLYEQEIAKNPDLWRLR